MAFPLLFIGVFLGVTIIFFSAHNIDKCASDRRAANQRNQANAEAVAYLQSSLDFLAEAGKYRWKIRVDLIVFTG